MCSLKSCSGWSIGPASRRVTLTPRSARTLVTVPPPAPEPMMTTSATGALRITWGMPRLYVGNQPRGALVYNLQIEAMDEVGNTPPAPEGARQGDPQPNDSGQRAASTVTIS